MSVLDMEWGPIGAALVALLLALASFITAHTKAPKSTFESLSGQHENIIQALDNLTAHVKECERDRLRLTQALVNMATPPPFIQGTPPPTETRPT